MKTIAQQLKITEFPFEIKNKDGNRIYYENSDRIWCKREYDSAGNEIYYEDCYGFWYKREYDSDGNAIHYEDSNGNGVIRDNRPKKDIITVKEMKTPVEELFKRLWDEPKDKFVWYAIRKQMLEKEKEVIQRAYKQGVVDEYGDTIDLDTITEAEEYYNRTFNTKEV